MAKPAILTVDYIIVGSGPAGCALASRLHAGNPALSILIIETGPDVSTHPLTTLPLSCFSAHHTALDYDYRTVPQRQLDNKPCYNCGGKALSGSSAINYGTWTRGSATDYDFWAEKVNDRRWSYEGLLPYFRRTEHHFDEEGDRAQHGFEGPIYTASISSSHPERKYPLRESIKEAWLKLGYKGIEDGNSGKPLGVSECVENWKDGKRQLASRAYDLEGVEILTDSTVAKVIFEDSKDGEGNVATGVRLVDGRTVGAKKEVILSAGAYRTPHLLMLSGIGDREELSRHGIEVVVENSDVGKNFHDHLALAQWWKLRHPERGLAMGTKAWTNPAFYIGLPVDWLVYSSLPFEPLKAALDVDGDEGDEHGVLRAQRAHLEMLVPYVPAGAAVAGVNVPIDGTYIGSFVGVMQPTSRGQISISSSNPLDPPVINPNYYASEVDRVQMRHGVREVLKLIYETVEGKSIVGSEVAPEGLPVLTTESTDEDIDARVRRVGITFYHAGGSASMGKVVDSECRVVGVKGLRVVDASVLPVSVSAHYQVPVYAVAERAADMILGM
jgi:choline dehydrogenase-like flavoprotein